MGNYFSAINDCSRYVVNIYNNYGSSNQQISENRTNQEAKSFTSSINDEKHCQKESYINQEKDSNINYNFETFSNKPISSIIDVHDYFDESLKTNIDYLNAIPISKLTKKHHDKNNAIQKCSEYIRLNFIEISKTGSFLDEEYNDLEINLWRNLSVHPTQEIGEALHRWYKHDKNNRRHDVHSFIKKIRLTESKYEDLLEIMLHFLSECNDCTICKTLFDDLTALHHFPECSSKLNNHQVVLENILNLAPEFHKKGEREYRQSIIIDPDNYACPKKAVTIYAHSENAMEVKEKQLSAIKCENEYYHKVMIFNDGGWIEFCDAPIVQLSSAAVFENHLLIFGGVTIEGKTDQVWEISLTTKKITSKRSMLEKRCSSAAGVLGNYIYVSGGTNENIEILNSVERYDHSTDTWTFAKPMETKRAGHALLVHQGQIYVFGGYQEKSVEVFNPADNKWKYVADMKENQWDHAVAAIQDNIFVVGGSNLNRNLQSVLRLHIPTGVWYEVIPLPTGQRGRFAVVMDDKIVYFGQNKNYRYDQRKDKWEEFESSTIFEYHAPKFLAYTTV